MASEEVTITVSTEVDTSSLEDLETMLDNLSMTAAELGDNLSEGLGGVDPSGVQETGDAAEEAAGGLGDMDDAAKQVKDDVDGIDPDAVKETGDNASGAASDMEAMGSAAAGLGAGATLGNMVDTAGNIGDSYNRLGLTFGTVTQEMKNDMSAASAETGRSGATVRDYYNQMGIAGIKNSSLLKSSFESIAGRAYQTGQDIGTLESAVQRMVLTGNAGSRQLRTLGISADDLGRAMGVSGDEASSAFEKLSQEERLKVLQSAMGDGKQANEDYSNSWNGVKEKAGAAMAGLMGAVGKPLLTILIPAINAATTVINGLSGIFNALPGPLQTVISAVAGLSLGFFALLGTLPLVVKTVKGLKAGLDAAKTAVTAMKDAIGIARTAFDTLKTAASGAAKTLVTYAKAAWEAVAAAIKLALAAIRTALAKIWEAIQTAADTIVKWANAIAAYALAIAEWLLATPILLVVIAVVAAVAIFLYFYNSNEQVRNSVNGLIAAFWNFLAAVAGAIMGAVGYITSLPGRAWNALMQTINRVLQFGGQFINNLRSAALRGVLGFISSITSLPGKLASELSRTLNNVISWGSQIVAKFGGIAQQAWQAFIGGLGIGSPGYISIQTDTELQRVSDSADAFKSQYQRKFEVLGQTVTGAYTSGNSTITTNLPSTAGNATGGVGNNGGNVTINIQGDVLNDKLVNKIVKEITNALKFDNTKAGRTIGDVSG